MSGYSGPMGVSIDEIDEQLRPASQVRTGPKRGASPGTNPEPGCPRLIVDMIDGKPHHWVVSGADAVASKHESAKGDVWAMVKRGTYLDALNEAARADVGIRGGGHREESR